MSIHARRIKAQRSWPCQISLEQERFLGSHSSFLSTLVDLCSLKKEDCGAIFNENSSKSAVSHFGIGLAHTEEDHQCKSKANEY
jgi:hypothetical protein